MQAHTAREHVGSLSRKNWTLRRMLVEVRKGADSPKPPQERGLQGLSHARVLKRIQLSRPNRTACCMTDGGTAQAHTAREHIGSPSRKNWTLRRMLVEAHKGAD